MSKGRRRACRRSLSVLAAPKEDANNDGDVQKLISVFEHPLAHGSSFPIVAATMFFAALKFVFHPILLTVAFCVSYDIGNERLHFLRPIRDSNKICFSIASKQNLKLDGCAQLTVGITTHP